jgi:hypothetical protein
MMEGGFCYDLNFQCRVKSGRVKKQHEHFNVTDNVHYVLLSTINTRHHFGLIATMCPIIRMCEVKYIRSLFVV